MVKELLSIVLAVALWGAEWKGGLNRSQCNNAAVVAIKKSGWSKNILAIQLLRSLFYLTAKWGIVLSGVRIPGKKSNRSS